MIEFKKYEYPIAYMPIEARRDLLPKHSICSIAPAELKSECQPWNRSWHQEGNKSEYFITANGSHWMQIAGQPYHEECVFTQEMLFRPLGPKTPLPPDMRGVLPKMRALLLQGKFEEVDDLVDAVQKNSEMGKYMIYYDGVLDCPEVKRRHTAFRLTFHQPECEKTWDYLRWLETQNGKVSAVWTNEKGSFCSESFAAYDGDFTVTRFHAPAGALDMDIIFHAQEEDFPKEYIQCTAKRNITPGMISYAMAYERDYGERGYTSVVRLIPQGGSMEVLENGIRVTGSDNLLVLTRTGVYEDHFSFDAMAKAEQDMMLLEPDFEKLLAANEAYVGSRMDRSRIRLGKTEDEVLSGEELLARTHSEQSLDPTMLEKLYDMSRFFQIYETGRTVPPLWGHHNINCNLQVCAGNNTGLWDEMDVFFRFFESKYEDFRKNAMLLFGARGLLAPAHVDPDSGSLYHFSHSYPHFCWVGCLGWIYNEFWGYYLVTGDKDFLRERIIPGLKEIALFFEDYACDRDENGKAIFYPSFSPEDASPYTPGIRTISINSVMDIGICREVLLNLIEGCRILGIEEENIPHWEEQLASLPAYLLDAEGGLKEWAWPGLKENYNHRHVSHHYEVWPGRLITPEDTPELAEAVRISNRKRAHQNDSAHGIVHRAFTAIRLKDLEETVANMTQLMTHGFVLPTLQTNHYPYHMLFPDLLGAMAGLLIEMSVFSMPGTVEFLPAMPNELAEGKLEGIWLYTFAKMEYMEWNKDGVKAEIKVKEAQNLTLRCRRPIKEFRINGAAMTVDGDHVQYTCNAGETIKAEIIFAAS